MNNKKDFCNIFNFNHLKSLRSRFDKDNMFKSISDFKGQIIHSFDIESKWYIKNKNKIKKQFNDFDSVLICGMGGSAIGGELAQTVLYDDILVPIVINRSSDIPHWVNSKTLVIISSYSGNTYETIESLNQARKKTKKIIAISCLTGNINNICLNQEYPILNIPSGLQPRCALGYISSMIILVLSRVGLTRSSTRIRRQLKESVRELKNIDRYLNDSDSLIFSISHKIKNCSPIIYGFENSTSIVALRFKNQLQENAKMFSFSNTFPEISHNEIESWNNNSNNFVIWLKKPEMSEKDSKVFNASFNIIDKLNVEQEIITLNNKYTSNNNKIARLYKMIYFLDWVSYYTALLNNVNPTTINNIKLLKKSIN